MLRIYVAMVVVAATMAIGAVPALADDADAINSCLKEAFGANTDARACIGRISNPCLEKPEKQSTHAMVACIGRETNVWDGLLNAEYQRLLGAVAGKTKDDVTMAQRHWIAQRDMDCAIPYSLFEGGTMAQPIGANCLMENTAERMLQIRAWLLMVQPEND
jgi:uncharacterized protein YecT (DUF1311 family)